MHALYEVWPTRTAGRVRWWSHRRNRNGRIDRPSQGYATASNARRAIRRADPDATIVTLRERPRG